MYIFVDESGDLGSKKGSSQFFILTALVVPEVKPVEKIIKALRRSLRKKRKNVSEFHAYHMQAKVIKKLLVKLTKIKGLLVAFTIFVKENNLSASQQEESYINLSENLLLMIYRKIKTSEDEISITFDKRYGHVFSQNFIDRVGGKIRERFSVKPTISFESSESNKGLQAVDFVSWSLFRYIEKGEMEYFNLIKDKIIDKKSV